MRRKHLVILLLVVIVLLVGAGTYLYLRPVPDVKPVSLVINVPKTQAVALPWPGGGQAAVGAVGYGVLASNNTSTPVSIASIAKIISALAILQQKPLALNETGPVITLDSTDLGYYDYYTANGGSAVNVSIGEQINEYQALEAMLLPSANNVADSTARWAFGSTAAYTAYANKMVKDMGLANTTVGSASGFADDTTATADDLVKLGIQALANPVIAQIVDLPAATIPVAGDIKNVNWLLGTNGVVGIKTGNTDKAGGCYLFAANHQIQGHSVTIVGAILGQPALNDAISAAKPLLQIADSGFTSVDVVHKGQTIGLYATAWNESGEAVASNDMSLFVWKGSDIKVSNNIQALKAPAKAGQLAGSVTTQSDGLSVKSNLTLNQNLPAPDWQWRLFR